MIRDKDGLPLEETLGVSAGVAVVAIIDSLAEAMAEIVERVLGPSLSGFMAERMLDWDEEVFKHAFMSATEAASERMEMAMLMDRVRDDEATD